MLKKLSISIAFLVVLSGCGGMVKTDVSSFHMMPKSIHGKHYYIFPCEEESSYLECNSYLDMIKEKLNGNGMIESGVENSEYYIFVSYDIGGKTVKSSMPIIGQTGVSGSHTFGTVNAYGNYGTYSGTTVNYPQFGVIGTKNVERTSFVRRLNVDVYFFDEQNKMVPKKIYEGKAISEGSKDNLSLVMPAIIDSLFEDFPGESGKTKTVIKKIKE